MCRAAAGRPYVSGAEGPIRFVPASCYCLRRRAPTAAGTTPPAIQGERVEKITKMSDLKRGDLMFFWSDKKGKIGHISIYIGNGMMIDASSKTARWSSVPLSPAGVRRIPVGPAAW